jgi:preprotein translocase SecE subunit
MVQSIKNYFRSSLEELRKVTWPTKNRAIRLTVISLVFMLAAAAIVGVMDLFFNCGYSSLILPTDFFTAFGRCLFKF